MVIIRIEYPLISLLILMLLIIRMLYFQFNIIIIVRITIWRPLAIRRNKRYPKNKVRYQAKALKYRGINKRKVNLSERYRQKNFDTPIILYIIYKPLAGIARL